MIPRAMRPKGAPSRDIAGSDLGLHKVTLASMRSGRGLEGRPLKAVGLVLGGIVRTQIEAVGMGMRMRTG